MSRGTAAPSAWILNEGSCGANSKSAYSLEQSCGPPLNTQVNEQEINACCSVLELFLEQNLTDTDGLNREYIHFYLSIWEENMILKKWHQKAKDASRIGIELVQVLKQCVEIRVSALVMRGLEQHAKGFLSYSVTWHLWNSFKQCSERDQICILKNYIIVV